MPGFSAKGLIEQTLNVNQTRDQRSIPKAQSEAQIDKGGDGDSRSTTSLLSALTKASMGVVSSRMIPDDVPDESLDRYVADLILQEAREKRGESSKGQARASPLGLDSQTSKAAPTNKRFLSSLIRQTDGHNRAVIQANLDEAAAGAEERRVREARESGERRERLKKAREAVSSPLTFSNASDRAADSNISGVRARSRDYSKDSSKLRGWSDDKEVQERHEENRKLRGWSQSDDDQQTKAISSDNKPKGDGNRRDHKRRKGQDIPGGDWNRKKYALSSPTPGDRTAPRSSPSKESRSRSSPGRSSSRSHRPPDVSSDRAQPSSSISIKGKSSSSSHERSQTEPSSSSRRRATSISSPPSKMDKYFASDYDPALDVEFSDDIDSSTGLLRKEEESGWANMLEVIRQRERDSIMEHERKKEKKKESKRREKAAERYEEKKKRRRSRDQDTRRERELIDKSDAKAHGSLLGSNKKRRRREDRSDDSSSEEDVVNKKGGSKRKNDDDDLSPNSRPQSRSQRLQSHSSRDSRLTKSRRRPRSRSPGSSSSNPTSQERMIHKQEETRASRVGKDLFDTQYLTKGSTREWDLGKDLTI